MLTWLITMCNKLTQAQKELQLTRLNTFNDTLKAEHDGQSRQNHLTAKEAFDGMMLTPNMDKFLGVTLADIGSGSLKSMFDKETARRK